VEKYVITNWTTGGYFYDVGSWIGLVGILLFVNILPSISRKFSFLLFVLYYALYSYLSLFIINFYYKKDHYNIKISHGVGLLPFAITSGLLINVVANGKK